MRHACFLIVMSFVLSGCKMEDTGSSEPNPATDVDLTFSTFDLKNTNEAPDNLEHTRFSDFYRGIQPSGTDDNTDNRETAAEIRTHIDRFIGASQDEDGVNYEKVRNPLDLINQVIASAEVNNFQEGRRYISRRIAEGQAGTYNTRSNGAVIRFTDQSAVLSDAPLNDIQWVYPTLDWTYQPANSDESRLDEKVYRTVQYVSRNAKPENAEIQPELISLLAGSRFNANDFSINGYNSPEFATADYLSRNYGSIEFRQEFIRDKTDTLFIKGIEEPVLKLSRHRATLSDPSPDCLRVELDYISSMLRIYTSNGEPPTLPTPTQEKPDKTSPNPAHCSQQETHEAVASWRAAGSPTRQQ